MGLFILLLLSVFCSCKAIPLQGLDCNDDEVFNAVDVALKKYNGGRRDGNIFALSVILEANRTADPGKTFLVKYQVRETACAVGEGVPWQNCDFVAASEGDSGECTAEVYIDDTLNLSSVQQTCKINPAPGKVTISHSVCLGCWQPINTKSLELHPVVRYGIQQFNNESEESAIFEVGKILKAQRQVVSGWNYEVEYSVKKTNCSKAEFPILTPACRTIPEGHQGICTVIAYIHFTGKLVSATQRCRLQVNEIVPSPVCAGCPVNISTDSPEVQEPLAAALEKYNSESHDDYYYTVVQITRATSQVVAGMKYKIDFTIMKTNCSKAEFPKLTESCTATEESQQLNCNASIYVKAWESVILPTVKCREEQPKEHKAHGHVCAGCRMNIATDSPELQKPLAAALEKYNSKSRDDYYYKVVEIRSATSQVVSGMIYRLEIVIRKTNCSKAEFPKLTESCAVTEDSEPLNCNVSVFERAWESTISSTANCKSGQPQKHFERRPPGFTPFRSARGNITCPDSENRDTAGKRLGLGHKRGHGHSHSPGHCHHHTKKKDSSSKESHEDVQNQKIPNQPSTSKAFLQEEDVTRNPNEDLFGFPDPPLQYSPASSISIFNRLPDLPEPLAPKCPGRPWKPITVPRTPLQGDLDDFTLADLLPAPDEGTAEPHETASATTTQRSFADFDLADALL